MKSVLLAGISLLVAGAASPLLAQVGSDTPTGAAGGFGGTIEIGSGTFDPYEMNASRSVTDVVVPGAVVPFAYTRHWNSRGGPPGSWNASGTWRSNWSWDIEADVSDQESTTPRDATDRFYGYYIYYPDGRVVQFLKPGNVPEGTPGTYRARGPISDRFIIDSDRAAAHLYFPDGSVLNFDMSSQGGMWPAALVTPSAASSPLALTQME